MGVLATPGSCNLVREARRANDHTAAGCDSGLLELADISDAAVVSVPFSGPRR